MVVTAESIQLSSYIIAVVANGNELLLPPAFYVKCKLVAERKALNRGSILTKYVYTYVRTYVRGGSRSGMSRGMSLHTIDI